ncbi:MAG: hypothetical protein ACREDU_06260 [Methylocella sp.]
MVKPSFIPPQDLRELRVVSRYRQKVSQTWAGEKTGCIKSSTRRPPTRRGRLGPQRGLSPSEASDGRIDGTPIEQLPDRQPKAVCEENTKSSHHPSTAN